MLELVAPSDQHLPHFGRITARTLEAGELATLHYWFGQCEVSFACKLSTPGLRLTPRALHVEQGQTARVVPWRDVFMVQGAVDRFVQHRRLCDLPWKLARELRLELDECDERAIERDAYELRDSFRRALDRDRLFARGEYAPSFAQQLDSRAAATRAKLAEWPDAPEPHHYPPAGWQGRLEPHPPEHPGYRETLDQLGMRERDDGTWTVNHPAAPLQHGPERPQGPGTGHLDYWTERLRRVDTTPGYVNSVPVRRLPCVPLRFEVTLYHLTAECGLGTGGRQPITRVCTLLEAAELVQRGECKHHQYSRGVDRWSEVG